MYFIILFLRTKAKMTYRPEVIGVILRSQKLLKVFNIPQGGAHPDNLGCFWNEGTIK